MNQPNLSSVDLQNILLLGVNKAIELLMASAEPFDKATVLLRDLRDAFDSPEGKTTFLDSDRIDAIDDRMADGDRFEIWVEDGGVILSLNGTQLNDGSHASLREALSFLLETQLK